MKWQQLVTNIFLRISQELEMILDGLTVEELNKQPAPDANTIGWLIWHLTRGQDRGLGDVMGEEQLWIKDKWYAKFNRAPDPADTGFRHSPKDIAAFRSPDGKTLLEYHRAVLERSRRYLEKELSETDLEREVARPTLAMVLPVHALIVGAINDGLQHVGQAAYVRGLIKGQGWRR
jgi:hypothetical protein